MVSNVYTKNEILQDLALKGQNMDISQLDSLIKQWQIEAIFEDENGQELFDKSVANYISEKLREINKSNSEKNLPNNSLENNFEIQRQPQHPVNNDIVFEQQINRQVQNDYNLQMQYNQPYRQEPQYNQMQYNQPQNLQMRYNQPQNMWQENIQRKPVSTNEFNIQNPQTSQMLKNITLSDGNNLYDRIKSEVKFDDFTNKKEMINDISDDDILGTLPSERMEKSSVLEDAMEAAGLSKEDLMKNPQSQTTEDTSDFDDISLLSESLEAQEKLRQYVVSELSKKNMDLTPQNNEFKLDISERTINMIARTVAKKIAKNVTAILTADAKNSAQIAPLKAENEKLSKRTKELEDQNKKLKLLLTESNKNLNSYKPIIFGLYKKVND